MYWDDFSTRREEIWSKQLVRAFVISIVLHVVIFGVMGLGLRAGFQAPAWMRMSVTPKGKPLTPEELRKQQIQLGQEEPPMLFVEVDPAAATQEAPPKADFYSAQNSVAANPTVQIETQTPKFSGTQEKVPGPETPRIRRAEPLQQEVVTAPPAPRQETPPPPAVTQPQQVAAVEPRKTGETEMRRAEEEQKPAPQGAMTVSSNAPARVPPRPTRLAQVKPQASRGESFRQEGGVRRQNMTSSLDVKATPFGAYDGAIIAAIRQRWYDLLEDHQFDNGRSGKVVLEFQQLSDGRVIALQETENTVGAMLVLLCQRAVLDPAPFAPWPSDMRRLIRGNSRLVKFTFYYD